jgi:hypothetical protein
MMLTIRVIKIEDSIHCGKSITNYPKYIQDVEEAYNDSPEYLKVRPLKN